MAPKLRDALPDPSHLLDLEVAVERLADAVQADERIGLLGDYDVDGATSIAVLARYLAAVGATTAIDVPDRLREGYGPNPAALARLAGRGCRLVVTLDSGTTAFEPLRGRRGAGSRGHRGRSPRRPGGAAAGARRDQPQSARPGRARSASWPRSA